MNNMRSARSQTGFTLIELMMVTAIIGILVSVALPAYDLYRNKSRFAEAILAVGAHRSAIITAASIGRASNVTDFDSGALGLPPVQPQTATDHGISVTDGAITITWRADGTGLAGVTYVLTAQSHIPPIQWTTGGTCLAGGYC